MNKILQGDCLIKLKELEDNSVDSIVTDPPYELGFMGKSWDNTGIANNKDMWAECLRVLKPGGYLLSFGGTITYHRMASAIEDAGFEVRDMIAWCYGQGFPKSLNISLQIKKKYNIGLCTCNVFKPMLKLECNNLKHSYENSNNKRDNISNGDNDGLSFGEKISSHGNDDNEVEKQTKNTNLSPDCTIRKESGVCELSEKDNKKEQGFEKVSESILQSGVCESISENEGLGNTTLRSGVEKDKTTSEGEGQGVPDMQNETTDGIASSSLNTIQNGGQELNGEPSGSLSQLPQQDRENNRKRIEEIKNDCNAEEWNNLSRFICSKCYCLKKDVGGTALKPSIEPICLARKPLAEKTVAKNVLKYGTGGINIDESRVETSDEYSYPNGAGGNSFSVGEEPDGKRTEPVKSNVLGRFPANLIHDNSEEVRECFPESKSTPRTATIGGTGGVGVNTNFQRGSETSNFNDSGNASRFFKSIKTGVGEIEDTVVGEDYHALIDAETPQRIRATEGASPSLPTKSIIYQAKASKSERNKGCEGLEDKDGGCLDGNNDMNNNRKIGANPSQKVEPTKNNHPTVKPIALMEYLIKMVTPKGGIVLDPFAGSGSTLVAAKQNGYQYIGIEMTEEYIPIIEARLKGIKKDNTLF